MQEKLEALEQLRALEADEKERRRSVAEEEVPLDEDELRVLRGHKALQQTKPEEKPPVATSSKWEVFLRPPHPLWPTLPPSSPPPPNTPVVPCLMSRAGTPQCRSGSCRVHCIADPVPVRQHKQLPVPRNPVAVVEPPPLYPLCTAPCRSSLSPTPPPPNFPVLDGGEAGLS